MLLRKFMTILEIICRKPKQHVLKSSNFPELYPIFFSLNLEEILQLFISNHVLSFSSTVAFGIYLAIWRYV